MHSTDTSSPCVAPMPHQERPESVLPPICAILCAVLLWGCSFAAMGHVLKFLNPMSVMWLRMVIPLVVLLPFAGKLIPLNYKRGDWTLLLPMVLFQPCLYFLLESNALRLTTSSQAGVVSAFVPLMVAIGAYATLGEPLAKKSLMGLAVSFTGVLGLTLMQGDGSLAANPYLGNALELCAMACAAGNMLIIKKLCRRYNAWMLTSMQIAAGAIFFSPGLWYLTRSPSVLVPVEVVLTLIFLGIGVTLGAFGCYNWGMSRMPAGRASAYINLVPVIAVLFGWGVMGEVMATSQLVAATAVVGGIWLGQKR